MGMIGSARFEFGSRFEVSREILLVCGADLDWGTKRMKVFSFRRVFDSWSDNRQYKTRPELGRRIENRKLVRLLAVAFALSAMLFALCSFAGAQQAGKVFRIGFLDSSTASGITVLVDAFRQELNKLGWIEGKNLSIDYRFAENKGRDRLAELAAELVRLKVDLIVVTSGPAASVAKGAATTIPIVITSSVDPVGEGVVASLARPGGNVTGLSTLAPELNTKRLEILKDAVPKLARVGVLHPTRRGTITSDLQLKELNDAALALKLALEEIETQLDAKSLESAFQTAKQKKVNAIMSTATRPFFSERKRIVELASKYRLPAIYFSKRVCR